jgi:4-amino-4-deoxy-L-arabinose transferase-like glycosyltransferase
VSNYPKLILAAVLTVFFGMAIASARTNMPWADEAWFSTPAWNLLTKGYPGVSVLDEMGGFHHMEPLRIHRRAYWQPPLHMLAQAVWYRLVGFSLFTLRYLSAFWGLAALLSWYFIMKTLFRDERVALLTVALMAVDFTVVWTASEGRMDMMTSALGQAAFASFLLLREKRFWLAVLVSQTLVAAGGMTHPMGLGNFAALLALGVYLDRKRLLPAIVGLAIIPYLVGAAGWGWYALQDREAFLAQFGGNIWGRMVTPTSFSDVLHRQIVERYLNLFGMAPDTQGFSHLKIFILFAYAAGLFGVLLAPKLRALTPVRALLWMLAAGFSTFMALDFQEIHSFYLIHFVLLLVPLLAAWTVSIWDCRPSLRAAVVAFLACVFLIQGSVTARRVTLNAYANIFLPATDFLNENAVGKGIIMGSAELGFELGFDGDLVDDHRLGVISGKKPAYIVIDHNRYEDWIPTLQRLEPENYGLVRGLMDRNFHLVFDNKGYKIYARNSL